MAEKTFTSYQIDLMQIVIQGDGNRRQDEYVSGWDKEVFIRMINGIYDMEKQDKKKRNHNWIMYLEETNIHIHDKESSEDELAIKEYIVTASLS